MKIDQAIEVFMAGFSITRSQTYPHVAQRCDPMWVMQDAPGRKKPRKIEVINHGRTPREVVQSIQTAHLGWHFLCDIHAPDTDFEARRSAFKLLGYRPMSTEWMFYHPLDNVPKLTSMPEVKLVTDASELATIPFAAAQGLKLIPDTRLFMIWDDERDYGFVRSVDVGEHAWVSGLYVRPDVRGQGFGRALMSSLLTSDEQAGKKASVLLATAASARLYPHMGYHKIAVLQMFCPKDRITVA